MPALPTPKPQASFMKAELLRPFLNKNGKAKFKINGEPTINKNGWGIDVPGTIGKQAFIQRIKETGRDYALICDKIGTDSEDWEGHTLTLVIRSSIARAGPNKGKMVDFVNVESVE